MKLPSSNNSHIELTKSFTFCSSCSEWKAVT